MQHLLAAVDPALVGLIWTVVSAVLSYLGGRHGAKKAVREDLRKIG